MSKAQEFLSGLNEADTPMDKAFTQIHRLLQTKLAEIKKKDLDNYKQLKRELDDTQSEFEIAVENIMDY